MGNRDLCHAPKEFIIGFIMCTTFPPRHYVEEMSGIEFNYRASSSPSCPSIKQIPSQTKASQFRPSLEVLPNPDGGYSASASHSMEETKHNISLTQ